MPGAPPPVLPLGSLDGEAAGGLGSMGAGEPEIQGGGADRIDAEKEDGQEADHDGTQDGEGGHAPRDDRRSA